MQMRFKPIIGSVKKSMMDLKSARNKEGRKKGHTLNFKYVVSDIIKLDSAIVDARNLSQVFQDQYGGWIFQ